MRSATMFPQEADRSASSGTEGAASRGAHFLGRYRIVEEIGVGGMASVLLARIDGPGGFQKWAAIKKIHPHLVDDESVVRMFLDEARVAARISHPNVATVFDLDKLDTTYWIAMEYLHGEPLRELMRRADGSGSAIPPEITCRIIADAAEGLHAAHELLGTNGENLGLVHRDVSPHNLFVTYEGVTKVVDFGIAKFSSRAQHTGAGVLKGKLAYMSPEQARSGAVDRRTDVFALGVILWELTTGQRLFWTESDVDTFANVEECAVPRPSSIIDGYPRDLEQIVMRALAKDRADRFGSARELSRALQSLLMHREMFVTPDEVASYMQEAFAERIRTRDAQLRWAAEVTETGVERRFVPPPAVQASVAARSEEVTGDAGPITVSSPIATAFVIESSFHPKGLSPGGAQPRGGEAGYRPSAIGGANAWAPGPPRSARSSRWLALAISASVLLFVTGVVLGVIGLTRAPAVETGSEATDTAPDAR